MNNLYTIYTDDEIDIFKQLSIKNDTLTPTSKLLEISKKIPIFNDIPENILIKILKDIKIIKYKKDEIIINENENDDTILFILIGSVKVLQKQKLITTLSNHTIIGEMASLLNEKRTASIISNSDSTIIISFKIDFSLNHSSLGFYFSIIYKNLAKELAKKILHQNQQIINK